MEKAEKFQTVPVNLQLDKQLQRDKERIRKGLIQIVKTLILCGRQNIPIRGHLDNSILNLNEDQSNKNLGNFNSLLLFRIESGDLTLKEHLEKSSRNSIYTTNTSQNQLLSICGDVIKKQVLQEIKGAYFTILADETSDISGREQLCLCIRYVHKNTIREEFIEYIEVDNTSGLNLSDTILKKLSEWDLDISKLRGQGYDGASNMSGRFKGVKTRILEKQPLALYTHCVAHNLNLVIVESCQLPEIRNMIGTVKQVIIFFRESAQRNSVFKSFLEETAAFKRLHALCETRWTDRSDALKVFIELLKTIFDALEFLKNSSEYNTNTVNQANLLLTAISQFQFFIIYINGILKMI